MDLRIAGSSSTMRMDDGIHFAVLRVAGVAVMIRTLTPTLPYRSSFGESGVLDFTISLEYFAESSGLDSAWHAGTVAFMIEVK
jgi:hypothetical protein